MSEMIVELNQDHVKINGCRYIQDLVRCKGCKWYHEIGCAIKIVDESDEPTDNDYCSFGERRSE